MCCVCCNPESRQTHSLHNNWYCSSFLKGKDEQRTINGSSSVTHTSTQSSSSSRMTHTLTSTLSLDTPHQGGPSELEVQAPGSPICPEHQWAGSMLEKEAREAQTLSNNAVHPSHVKHNEVSTEHSALQDFKYTVMCSIVFQIYWGKLDRLEHSSNKNRTRVWRDGRENNKKMNGGRYGRVVLAKLLYL